MDDRTRVSVARFLARNSKKRAKRLGVPHTISYRDIDVPDNCPITDVPLAQNIGMHGENSFTLDRINPALGYVPGNVKVLSYKANRAKSDLTVEQLLRLVAYIEGR